MQNLTNLDHFRLRGEKIRNAFGSEGNDKEGAFALPSPVDGEPLRVIASAADGWDHVSVSRVDRIPWWTEMEFIKRAFFEPHETAIQFHVPVKAHVNVHPNCLHIWRKWGDDDTRLPPGYMV